MVTIAFDRNAVKARIDANRDEGIFAVAAQALKDANYYCREDSGALIDSSINASDLENGLLVWDTPYAKSMYYTGHPSPDVNSNASLMWAHKGYEENKGTYQKILQKTADGG